MRVEFLKDWQRFRVGQVADHLSGGVVDALARTKVVRVLVGTAEQPTPPPAESGEQKPQQPKPKKAK